MKRVQINAPTPKEVAIEAVAGSDPWLTLTPERAKDLWRLSGQVRRLFDFSGDWFSASRDRAEYLAAFRDRVLATVVRADCQVYIIRGQGDAAFLSTVIGFLNRWPDLPLEGLAGYDVLPIDVSFWLQVHSSGTAHIAFRAGAAPVG